MAGTMSASTHETHEPVADGGKRDFLKLVALSGAAIGIGALAWPLVDSMNPSSDVLALSSTEVDLAPIPAGQGITVFWRGQPTFVRHRTPEEVTTVRAVPISSLIDPATDQSRTKAGHDAWLICSGVCTHLGCVPLGNKSTDPRGDFGGYYCPCHGSQYDVSGRVRHGPAPANLPVMDYAFETDTKVKIG